MLYTSTRSVIYKVDQATHNQFYRRQDTQTHIIQEQNANDKLKFELIKISDKTVL
jgi:hypothetical protein